MTLFSICKPRFWPKRNLRASKQDYRDTILFQSTPVTNSMYTVLPIVVLDKLAKDLRWNIFEALVTGSYRLSYIM